MEIVPHDLNIDFLGRRRLWISLSVALIVLGMAAALIWKMPLGIDFAGGTEFQLQFVEGVTADESQLRAVAVGAGFLDAEVVRFGEPGDREFLIKFKANPEEDLAATEAGQVDGLAANTRVARLQASIRESIGEFVEQRVEFVGPKVGAELRRDGANAMLMSAIAVLIYIAFRFSSRYAPGAVVALIHDVLVTTGLLVLANHLGLRVAFDLQVLAALLAIVGYSLNDTIIIYDRIRENLELQPGADLEKVLNQSVNQTMSRTVLTAGTTLLAVLALLLLGGDVIFAFSFTMLIGIVVGTYSSIFIAAPILLFLERRYGSKGKPGSSARPAATVKRARA